MLHRISQYQSGTWVDCCSTTEISWYIMYPWSVFSHKVYVPWPRQCHVTRCTGCSNKKVAYNRICRILMGLEHWTSMSAKFIVQDMDPFVVILCKAIASVRKHIQ